MVGWGASTGWTEDGRGRPGQGAGAVVWCLGVRGRGVIGVAGKSVLIQSASLDVSTLR